MPIFSSFIAFLFLFLLTCAPHPLSTTAIATHNRRTLHQPFFAQDANPPTEPPSPQPPTPKIPFSTSITPPNQQPFFPSFPSPPPPPPSPPAPSSFASFPANISSLSLPQSPKSKPVSSKLIATAIAAVLAAALILAVVLFLHIRKKKQQTIRQDKMHRSDSSNRFTNGNASASNGTGNAPPKAPRSSQTSSEFLYLGTLVNSHSGIDSQPSSKNARDNVSNVNPRKLDSPELRPLPPLSGQIYQHNYENAEVDSSREEDFEEFYSPRGSLGGRESSIAAGSASRRTFAAVAAENFESRRMMGSGSSSYSSSSSGSGSPARSVSLSISPPVSPSPISSRPKSPELVAIQTAPPSRPPPPPPPPTRLTTFSPSPAILSSPERESSSNSSSPERDSRKSQESSPGLSIFYPRNSHSPPTFSNSVSIPTPPPPPPPPPPPAAKDWESPRTPAPVIRQQFLKPPVLITPSRPGPIQSATPLVSPMELPAVAASVEKNEETPKPKLKPLHWDKVRASSDREMVWDQLKSSSFKLDEEMIETLFIVKTPNSNQNETTTRRPVLPSPTQENRVLDPKKSQNIAISLRALNVTIEEVCEALLEGNAETLGTELLESLLKMAPTKEEERKLKEYKEDSPFKLGPAEKFLKVVLDIPFAFKRVDAMLYISNFDSEVDYLKRAFGTLEAACEELRNSRMFLKLLEAVLKTGNRMNVGTNRGDAHAFKLDTLLKLVDVKGADGKTTLLHFVVQEIIRSEGARLSNTDRSAMSTPTPTPTPTPTVNDDAKCRKLGLQVVSGLSSDLTNVKKAAAMDAEVLNGDVFKLSKGISNIADVVRLNEGRGLEENRRRFSESMNKFMKRGEEEIIRIQAQESVALSLVKEITEYFHGNSAKEEAHPFRIFMVVRDFLTVLERVCKEVGTINERTIVSTAHKFPVPVNPTLPGTGRREYSWSDEEEIPCAHP